MKNLIKITVLAVMPVLLLTACENKREQQKTQVKKKRQTACEFMSQNPFTPAQCVAETALSANSFNNNCIGLSFESVMPFLYNAGAKTAQFVDFSVPKADYSIQVLVFQNPAKDINTPENKKAFMEAAKKNLKATNPKININKEEFVLFGGVPVIYISASNKGRLERYYFFNNRGRWVQLLLSAAEKNFTKNIKPAQDALLQTIRLY
ncbi:hypothetical protein FACS189437_01220 [Bacteroidia bacterium]|nr:hypothetical protein FACS189437_01220 [Bacteroidia bacterium]